MINNIVTTNETKTIRNLKKEIFGINRLPSLTDKNTVRYYLTLSLKEEVMGFIEMGKIDPETYEITYIGVLEKFRNMKVGTYLIKYGQIKLKMVGGRKMVASIKKELLPFFKSNNFRIYDEPLNIDGEEYLQIQRLMF